MTRIEQMTKTLTAIAAHRYPLILAYAAVVSTVHLILDLFGVFP